MNLILILILPVVFVDVYVVDPLHGEENPVSTIVPSKPDAKIHIRRIVRATIRFPRSPAG